MKRGHWTILILLLLIGAICLWWMFAGVNQVGQYFLGRVSSAEDRTWRVEAGHVGGNLLTHVELDSVRWIMEGADRAENEILFAEKVDLRWRPWSLTKGRVDLTDLEVSSARFDYPLAREVLRARRDPVGEERAEAEGSGIAIQWERIGVDDLTFVVTGGEKSLTLSGLRGTLISRPQYSTWDIALEGGELGRGDGLLPLHRLQAIGRRSDTHIAIEDAHLDFGSTRVALWLDMERRPEGAVEGNLGFSPLSLSDMGVLLGIREDLLRGGLTGELTVGERRDRMSIAGLLGGTLGDVSLSRLAVDLSLTGDSLRVRDAHGDLGEGEFAWQGTLLFGPQGGERGELTFQSIDPGPWLKRGEKEYHGEVNGLFSWDRKRTVSGEKSYEAQLSLADSRIGKVLLEDFRAEIARTAELGLRGDLRGAWGPDSFQGWFTILPDGALAGRFGIGLEGGAMLSSLSGGDAFTSRGRISGRLAGTRRKPRAHARGILEDLRFGAVGADTIHLSGSYERSDSTGKLEVELRGQGIGSGPAELSHVSLRLLGEGDRMEIRDLRFGRGLLEGEGDGRITREGGWTRVELPEPVLRLGEVNWRANNPLTLMIGPDRWRLPEFALSAGDARMTAEAELTADSLRASFELTDFEMRHMGSIARVGGPVAGTVNLAAEVRGTRKDPRARASVEIEGGAIKDFLFRDLRLGVSLAEGRLRIDEGSLVAAGGETRVSGSVPLRREDAPGMIHVRGADLRLASLRPLWSRLERVEGRADFDLTYRGPGVEPRIDLDVSAQELSVADRPWGDLHFTAGWSDSLLNVTEGRISGPSGEMELMGTLPLEVAVRPPFVRLLDNPMDLRARITDGHLGFAELLSPIIKRAEGSFTADIAFTGTPGEPRAGGEVDIHDGSIFFAKYEESVHDLEARLRIDGNRVLVNSLDMSQGKNGRVRTVGELQFQGSRLADYALAILATDYEPHFWRDVEGSADAELALTPRRLASGKVVPHLEGEVKIDELVVRGEFNRRSSSPEPEGEARTPAPPRLTYELQVHADNNLRVENSSAVLELEGDILAQRDEQGLRLIGELRTIRGRYFAYNNTFDISRGVFNFPNVRDLNDVQLDVLAETEVAGEKIEVTLSGTPGNPEFEASSESDWNDTYIFRTLTLGYQPEGDAGEGSFTNGLIASWRQALLDRWGNQVARELGVDDIRVIRDSNGEAATRLEVGKRIWSDVYLNLQYSVGRSEREQLAEWELRNPERLLSLEYRLSDRFTLDGEAGTVEGVEFLNVDLKFKWSY